jgi:RNA polymerase sigma-32 factor
MTTRPAYLTPADERRLARAARRGDGPARDEIVLAHLPLVRKMARRLARARVPREDLVHQGVLGLLIAVDRFDPKRGVRFATYARWWVRAYMAVLVRESDQMVSPPQTRGARRVRGHVGRVRRELEQRNGRPVANEELAEELGVDVREVERAGQIRSWTLLGTEHPRELLQIEPKPSPEEAAAERERRAVVAALAERAFAVLDERERRILVERKLGDEPRSLAQIGDELHVSRERVRQLESRALAKVRGAVDWSACM